MSLLESLPDFPETVRRPVVDEYHSVQVTDNYRWLEDFADPEVQRWNAAQNQYSRAALDAIPARKPLAERLREILTRTSADHYALKYSGSRLFAMKYQPPKQQPFLVAFKSAEDLTSEQIILDPEV